MRAHRKVPLPTRAPRVACIKLPANRTDRPTNDSPYAWRSRDCIVFLNTFDIQDIWYVQGVPYSWPVQLLQVMEADQARITRHRVRTITGCVVAPALTSPLKAPPPTKIIWIFNVNHIRRPRLSDTPQPTFISTILIWYSLDEFLFLSFPTQHYEARSVNQSS